MIPSLIIISIRFRALEPRKRTLELSIRKQNDLTDEARISFDWTLLGTRTSILALYRV